MRMFSQAMSRVKNCSFMFVLFVIKKKLRKLSTEKIYFVGESRAVTKSTSILCQARPESVLRSPARFREVRDNISNPIKRPDSCSVILLIQRLRFNIKTFR